MEYLAPGVYVEEVSSGNKPIEGASTSTAGMVGVTQRGPVNEPSLVTSFGDFSRLFGGLLDHRTFTDNLDSLPYAVQGFFNNGGQRVYVSRIIGPDATFA
ncbi:MAG: phage tail sheath family protein, partial [Psychromonas sp.]